MGERDEGEQEAVEDGGAVECSDPDAFLGLEPGEVPEAIKEEDQGRGRGKAGLDEVNEESGPALVAEEGGTPRTEGAP